VASPRTAWFLIGAIAIIPTVAVLWFGAQRSLRDIAFDNPTAGVRFVQRPEAWTIGLTGFDAVEIAGCPLDLVRTTLTEPAALRLQTASVPAGGIMVLRLVRPRNLQIVAGDESAVEIGAGTAFSGRSLTWTFHANRDLYLFADEAILEVAGSVALTARPEDRDRLSKPPARIAIDAADGVHLTCRMATVNGIRTDPAVAFIAGESTTPIRVAVGGEVTDPVLSGPRGSVLIGNRTIPLGAGTLAMDGQFRLEALDWTPGDVLVGPVLRGRSRDVRAGGEQLVPSMLSSLSEDPKVAAIVAVLAVVISSLVGKLFDHALR
jgi:hypothetical protein